MHEMHIRSFEANIRMALSNIDSEYKKKFNESTVRTMHSRNFKTKYSAKYINEILENIVLQSYEDMEYFPISTIKEIEFNKAYKPLPIFDSQY